MGREVITREEKFVKLLIDYVADLRLDLDMVGIYFARLAREVTFRRFETIYESAKHYKEHGTKKDRETHYESIRHINN